MQFFSQPSFSKHQPPAISASPDFYSEQKSVCDIFIFSVETETRFLLKTLFQLWNYRVEESDLTTNFLPVIKLLQPKIILVDSFLPFEDSLEFIAQIRQSERSENICIILISGFPENQYRKISLEAGADEYFEKPIDFNRMENYLRGKIKQFDEDILTTRRFL